SWHRCIGMANRLGDSQLRWVADGGLMGAVATYLNIASVTAHDAKFVWLPAAIGFALYSFVRRRANSCTVVSTYSC
ncbi:MAG: hypothetical protein ACYC6N_23725, partial [Pirellulaceae bacterium]